ncbi:MAG TPA: hypothetical protein VK936_14225 [Longimicrobiales bacterium]|nr:hypothetical protein [Longimicrobiales bacterium]
MRALHDWTDERLAGEAFALAMGARRLAEAFATAHEERGGPFDVHACCRDLRRLADELASAAVRLEDLDDEICLRRHARALRRPPHR